MIFGINTTRDILKLSRITILNYHSDSWYSILGNRGFFLRATGTFVSSAEGRRHDLNETGNRA